MLTHPQWAGVPGLCHGFLDRAECAGGLAVAVAAAGVPLPLDVPRQVHGIRVLEASGERHEADGLVTAAPGRVVGVVTADCVPVLLVAQDTRLAAAVHAGWRGAAGGVLEAAVGEMVARGADASRIEAAVGPAVGPCCYEVGGDVRDAFVARSGESTAGAWAGPERGKYRLDLRRAVSLLLAAVGVRSTTVLGPCTSCTPGYCSYRRDGSGAGRQLSFVGWS
jgi:purine-nucleoside/S-methyl-5'-thioadenosine phosphorylase / adenosine deaminase